MTALPGTIAFPHHLSPGTNVEFADSRSAADRRYTWDAIKRSDLSNNQRAALRYLVNLWFYHRNMSGVIHPGVARVAKAAKVSNKTAERCIREFRRLGFIKGVRYSKGGTGCATQYTLDPMSIWEAYLPKAPDQAAGELVPFRSYETPSKPRQNPVIGSANPVNLTDCLKGRTDVAFGDDSPSLDEMERFIWGAQNGEAIDV